MTNPGLWLVGLAAMLCVAQAAGAQEARLPRREVPGLDFRRDGVWRKQARAVRATRALLLGQRRFGELNAPLAAGAPVPSPAAVAGTLDVPVVLLRYTGTTAPPFAAADYDAVLFGATAPFGRPYTYHSFYSDLSNGLLDIQGASYGWTTLSGTEGAYNGGTSAECQQNNPYGTSNCNGVWSDAAFGALQGALREALANIDSQLDFSQFTYDAPTGIVSLVLFVHPTLGGECGPGSANHLWAHRAWLFPGYVTNDPWPGHSGQFLQVQDYIFQSGLGGTDSCTGTDIMPIGTVAHETGHGFGLPDLYDVSGTTEAIGRWSLMGAGNYSSPFSPARMDAWSLNELGWVTLAPVTTAGAYSFGAAPASDSTFLVRPTGSNPRGEYFLLENRQAVQADTALIRNACQVWYQDSTPPPCSGGLLVYHVDSAQVANGSSTNEVNSGAIHGVALVQADGYGNLDANANTNPCSNLAQPPSGCADRGDAGDPFPGIIGNTTLALSTRPSLVLNTGACPGFSVDTISQLVPNGAMRFVVMFGGDSVTIATTAQLPAGQWGYFYAAGLAATCGTGSYAW
ncbi:MAG TPA: M6 family metalloprotease domain-containing protein, partial [Gemmatimonadales bacterium]|nr:M6 family metalloprotease domain-containing protein [Gemmatimonadales bacterium]